MGATIRPVAELTWETQPSEKTNSYFGLLGAIWSVAEGFDLDAAGRVGSVAGERAFEIRLGLTWAVPVWHVAGEDAEPSSVVGSAARQ